MAVESVLNPLRRYPQGSNKASQKYTSWSRAPRPSPGSPRATQRTPPTTEQDLPRFSGSIKPTELPAYSKFLSLFGQECSVRRTVPVLVHSRSNMCSHRLSIVVSLIRQSGRPHELPKE